MANYSTATLKNPINVVDVMSMLKKTYNIYPNYPIEFVAGDASIFCLTEYGNFHIYFPTNKKVEWKVETNDMMFWLSNYIVQKMLSDLGCTSYKDDGVSGRIKCNFFKQYPTYKSWMLKRNLWIMKVLYSLSVPDRKFNNRFLFEKFMR